MPSNTYLHSVDSHFHYLSIRQKGIEPEPLLADLFASGMAAVLDVAIDTERWEERVRAAEKNRTHFLSAGFHPSVAGRPKEPGTMIDALPWAELERQLEHHKTIALGEIGLDWYRGRDAERQQRDLFERQLLLARARNLPIIVHCRDADADVHEALRSVALERGGIMHCFSSGYEFAVQCLDLGFMISFAGNVTYKNALLIQDAARRLPLDRILVETDAPYLAPVPMRGKTNHPGFLGHTIEVLAALRGDAPQRVAEVTGANFFRFFGLQGSCFSGA